MDKPTRRRFLEVLGAGSVAAATSSPLLNALAQGMPSTSTEFFLFIHAQGGWDITVSLDPRNARNDIVMPASTDSIDPSGLMYWTDGPVRDGLTSFSMVRPAGCNIPFGPAIGLMAESRRFERMCVINGIAMNTVSHPDGVAFSTTGRHLAGGRAAAPSVDTVLASVFGTRQLFPTVSVRFPSQFVGPGLDPKALPLRVDNIASVSRSLTRSDRYVDAATRTAVNTALATEAHEIAARSYFPAAYASLEQQLGALERIHSDARLSSLFSLPALRANPAYAQLFTPQRVGPMGPTPVTSPYTFESNNLYNAAFAVESFKLNLSRCVSFSTTSFDTHFANYEDHPQHQQELFNMLAGIIDALSAADHPTLAGRKLIDHTHIMVLSDFCRTPQINVAGGRDHYPNNSAVIISPKFRGNRVTGSSDPGQLLPNATRTFADGMRAITPADVLATFLSAFDIDPRRYMRDGDVMMDIRR
ncbi:MAG: DUF1501 domain-containing protein [Deltaproteobacteria bacterium]|nr:DUF1501 domain-containing protein [Deltaproteobacteria bacterium]